MAVGTIPTSILTDIANAIRFKAGVATLYKPREMAAAVAKLDGTNEGGYVKQPYMELESGVLPESALEAVGNAIRMQNGQSVKYKPAEMAPAILALEWDVGLKLRALLLADGTMEFNYLERRRSVSGGVIREAYAVDPAGYSSATARPWDGVKLDVRRVTIDASVAQAGVTSCAYWFYAFSNCNAVYGFESLSGVKTATQAFASCQALESIFATSFANAITSASGMFYGCTSLVGGTDGFVPSSTSAGSVCKLGAGGVLTNPDADARTWFNAHLYADGGAVLTATGVPEEGRVLLASGRVCANAKYQGTGFAPWDDVDAGRNKLLRAEFAGDMSTIGYLNLNYLFYACSNLAHMGGLGNLKGVRSMRYAFSSCAFAELDFRGFYPKVLTDLFYAFAACGQLTTIYADSTWELPKSGITGSQCFYNCKKLVGGNGTAYASSRTSYSSMCIDRAGQAGYLTAG